MPGAECGILAAARFARFCDLSQPRVFIATIATQRHPNCSALQAKPLDHSGDGCAVFVVIYMFSLQGAILFTLQGCDGGGGTSDRETMLCAESAFFLRRALHVFAIYRHHVYLSPPSQLGGARLKSRLLLCASPVHAQGFPQPPVSIVLGTA